MDAFFSPDPPAAAPNMHPGEKGKANGGEKRSEGEGVTGMTGDKTISSGTMEIVTSKYTYSLTPPPLRFAHDLPNVATRREKNVETSLYLYSTLLPSQLQHCFFFRSPQFDKLANYSFFLYSERQRPTTTFICGLLRPETNFAPTSRTKPQKDQSRHARSKSLICGFQLPRQTLPAASRESKTRFWQQRYCRGQRGFPAPTESASEACFYVTC